ncbi:hypothetical protein [Phenylobacterium sp.]|uniref:hypothetical protein n=1 Tax=Phenylobacterium sp. TaxID=1871053 RepID=UPI00301B89D1
MADLTITAANVLQGAGARTETGLAGAAVTAGQVVAKEATGKYVLADCDHATSALRSPAGIALHAAAANQPLTVLVKGKVAIGATVAASVPYFLSPTAGGICPLDDVLAGDFAVFLGFGISTSVIDVNIVEAGVVKA